MTHIKCAYSLYELPNVINNFITEAKLMIGKLFINYHVEQFYIKDYECAKKMIKSMMLGFEWL